jgi:predicted nucleic acid-binding protein
MPPILDTLIAATAVVHGLDLYTQDAEFEGLRGLRVVRV